MRIGIGGFVDGRGFVFVVGATLTRQLIDAERVVDVVRIGSDGMSVRKGRRQEQSVVVMRLRVMMMVAGSGRTGPGQHIVQVEG